MKTDRTHVIRGAGRISVGAIRAYLRSCFARQASPRVSELARTLGVSRGTLIYTFKELRGTTPAVHLKAEQLARAKRLLLQGLPLGEVARKAGYSSKRAFFRSFYDATGTTPGRFRNREQNVI